MKITLAIAAVVAIASAGKCQDDYDVKCTPADMKGEAIIRWGPKANGKGKVGTDAIAKADLKGLPKTCKKGARQFDAYCHQYGNKGTGRRAPKYADYGDCGQYDGYLEQVHCEAQQCMFDYCIWRRN